MSGGYSADTHRLYARNAANCLQRPRGQSLQPMIKPSPCGSSYMVTVGQCPAREDSAASRLPFRCESPRNTRSCCRRSADRGDGEGWVGHGRALPAARADRTERTRSDSASVYRLRTRPTQARKIYLRVWRPVPPAFAVTVVLHRASNYLGLALGRPPRSRAGRGRSPR